MHYEVYTVLSETLKRPDLCIPLRGSELQPATRSICLALSTCCYLYVSEPSLLQTRTKPAPLSHSHLFQSHNARRPIFLHLTRGAEGYLFMFAVFSLNFNAPLTHCIAAKRSLWRAGKPVLQAVMMFVWFPIMGCCRYFMLCLQRSPLQAPASDKLQGMSRKIVQDCR